MFTENEKKAKEGDEKLVLSLRILKEETASVV
jgi:hypothetical protein